MNNQQFRRLIGDQPLQNGDDERAIAMNTAPTASAARRTGFVGMAPRNVKRSGDTLFTRTASRPTKKFKSAAPMGSAIAKGFVDRAKARAEAEDDADEDDKATRIKALEKQMKDGEIDMDTFEKLREDITAGDVGSTHLIKGLDRKLLDRVRRGEDVLGLQEKHELHDQDQIGIDDELDRIETVEVEAVNREKEEKRGQTSIGSKKQSRDEIMAALKAQRKAAAEIQQVADPDLDIRWRRLDEKTKSRIEIDRKGREVLITIDEDGVVKKRVRKVPPTVQEVVKLDVTKSVLGNDIVVPEQAVQRKQPVEDDDDDIFEDAGTDYDPLGSERDSDVDAEQQPTTVQSESAQSNFGTKRNYFNDQPNNTAKEEDHLAGVKAIIEKAAKLSDKVDPPAETEADAARRAKHAAMLANRDRDLDDIDMGFGASRRDDGEDADADGEKIRLSEWRGTAGEDDDDKPARNHDKRKRKPKKRKGDADNIADIMNVIERRKDKK